jgi:hypothetical protein
MRGVALRELLLLFPAGVPPSLARIAGNKSSVYPVIFLAFLCASFAPQRFALVFILGKEVLR